MDRKIKSQTIKERNQDANQKNNRDARCGQEKKDVKKKTGMSFKNSLQHKIAFKASHKEK